MTCERLKELMEYELPHYQEQLRERGVYFDWLTKYDVWDYLVERDFQKRYFREWAANEKREFCGGCDANGSCDIR